MDTEQPAIAFGRLISGSHCECSTEPVQTVFTVFADHSHTTLCTQCGRLTAGSFTASEYAIVVAFYGEAGK